MNLGQQITDKLFNQCINLIGNDDNQQKLRNNIIDPLVTYFKQRLRFFYVTITLLLCLILIANIFMIFQFFSLKNQLNIIAKTASSAISMTSPV